MLQTITGAILAAEEMVRGRGRAGKSILAMNHSSVLPQHSAHIASSLDPNA